MGFLFVFDGVSKLIPFGSNSDLCWNCPAGPSELIPFGARLDLLWDLLFPEIPSRGFVLAFPRWGLLCLFVRGKLHMYRWGFTILLLSWGTTKLML